VVIDDKYNSLRQILESLGKVLIAYSGGVDSSFLTKVAVDVLGGENVLACIGLSASLGRSQYDQAIATAEVIGVPLREVEIDELDDSAYSANAADRCFHCKSHLFGILREIAEKENIEHLLCGSNFDDKDDYRPGEKAANKFEVRRPLMEAEMTKKDIRQLSKRLDLPTADMPASPCLASRINYGLEVTEGRLSQIDRAEDLLRSLGLVEFRVRHHDQIARIEVHHEDIGKITTEPNRSLITAELKGMGFKYVTVDLQGFRSGALNETLSEEEKKI